MNPVSARVTWCAARARVRDRDRQGTAAPYVDDTHLAFHYTGAVSKAEGETARSQPPATGTTAQPSSPPAPPPPNGSARQPRD